MHTQAQSPDDRLESTGSPDSALGGVCLHEPSPLQGGTKVCHSDSHVLGSLMFCSHAFEERHYQMLGRMAYLNHTC